jgi:hypothetical protein
MQLAGFGASKDPNVHNPMTEFQSLNENSMNVVNEADTAANKNPESNVVTIRNFQRFFESRTPIALEVFDYQSFLR